MIIILIILTVLATVIGIRTLDAYNTEIISFVSLAGAVLLGVIDVICVICICCYFTDGLMAKEKIKMYQEENTKIEEKIDVIVKQYMEYEGKTLKDFKSSSSMTLVSLYPELKSDELVKQQIKTYTDNNKKIKELQEKAIDLKVGKWLLYFGK